MPKPRLYLHIGYHKTGSTSLQSSLGQNRDRLARHGICYPENPAKAPNKHTALSAALRRLTKAGPADPADLADCFAPILRAAEGSEIVILSDEGFSTCDRLQIAALARLQDHFDMRVVAVVRRQDAFLQSWYQQLVKERRSTETFTAFLRDHPWERLFYTTALRRWAEVFGAEALRVVSFDLANLAPGRIHRAAVDLVTEGRMTEALPERDWNRTYPSVMIELLRRMALAEDLPAPPDAYMAAIRQVRNRGSEALTHPVFAKTYLTEGLRSEILARFEADNTALAAGYFDGLDPFPGFDRPTIPETSAPEEEPFTQTDLSLAALEMLRIQSSLGPKGAKPGRAKRPHRQA